MVTLEQVKLLETKVARAIGYVEKVSGENAELRGKLDSYQKRIDELEILIQNFKEDQGRIEDGILSALDRLNQFEDAIERSLDTKPQGKKNPKPASAAAPTAGGDKTEAEGSRAPDIEPEAETVSGDSGGGEELDIF